VRLGGTEVERVDVELLRLNRDVLVTDDGHRVLGRPIPKMADEVEEEMGEGR